MAKSKIDGKTLLAGEDPAAVAAAMKVEPADEQAAVLPTLDDEVCEPGKTIGRDLATPIRVLIGPKRTMGQIVRIEKNALAPGKKDGLRAPGQTLYLCTPVGQPEANRGTYEANQLFVLDKPAVVVLVPDPEPEPVVNASATAITLAADKGIDIATVEGTGKLGQITVADVKNVVRAAPESSK